MKNLLWYLIAGTKGGENRGRIIELLARKPANAHEIAKILTLDYKTIRHHLDILEQNKVILAVNKSNYGAVYFLSQMMEQNLALFGEIWAQFGKK